MHTFVFSYRLACDDNGRIRVATIRAANIEEAWTAFVEKHSSALETVCSQDRILEIDQVDGIDAADMLKIYDQ